MYQLNGRFATNLEIGTTSSRIGPYGNESVLLMTSFAVREG
jgi:hypothetical protein